MPVQTFLGPNGVLIAVVPDDTKVDLRRMCGFPATGFGLTGYWEFGLFLREYQTLELRLDALTVSEYARITSLYLPNLLALEQDIFNIRNTVNIDTAAVYKRNLREGQERHNEFMWWRRALCDFLGIMPGPNMQSSGGNTVNCIA